MGGQDGDSQEVRKDVVSTWALRETKPGSHIHTYIHILRDFLSYWFMQLKELASLKSVGCLLETQAQVML